MQIDKFYKQNGYKVADDFISSYKINKKTNAITTITVYYANGKKTKINYTKNYEENILNIMTNQAVVFRNSELYLQLNDYIYIIANDEFDKGVEYLNACKQLLLNNQLSSIRKLDYFLDHKDEFSDFIEDFNYIKEDTYKDHRYPKKILMRNKYSYKSIVNINNLDKFSEEDLKKIISNFNSYEKTPVIYGYLPKNK